MKLEILISFTKNEIQKQLLASFLQKSKENTCAGAVSVIRLNTVCLWKIMSVVSTKSCRFGQNICGLSSVLTQFFLTIHSSPLSAEVKIDFRKNPAWGEWVISLCL